MSILVKDHRSDDGRTKLTRSSVVEIRKRFSEGEDRRKLSLEFNVSDITITDAVLHKTWRHVPGPMPEKIIKPGPTEKDREEMLDVKDYAGFYSITPLGKVFSKGREVTFERDGKTYVMALEERVLRQKPGKNGYPVVTLHKDNVPMKRTVHSLVAEKFLPPPLPGQSQVRHKDGNKANPHAVNLAWATPKENAADRILHGTDVRGEQSSVAKLNDKKVLEIRVKVTEGCKRSSIAAEYGVSKSTIDTVVSRKTWGHI